MKANYLFLLFVFCCGIGFAQTKEDLSPEEQERRQKNIEAGNPFKEFGYTPKIATLSKGKYLEWHDLDSIVKIGSFSFHVKKKQVTGYTRIDPNNLESGLSPEVISRWLSPDPLAEEFPDWTPYRYGFNNPVRYTDPTGLLEWDPQVNEDGSVSYIAEAGDSAETFASQYGLSQSAAEAITGTTGNTAIAEGTEVSGGRVREVTGSEVLKLDLDSPEGKSSQRRFDHFMFAADHSRSQGAWSFLSTDYFSNTQFKDMMSGWATATTGDRSFQVYYNIPMYRSSTFDGSGTGVGISNSPFTIRQRGGSVFGPQQDNVRGEVLHPGSGNNMGYYDIQVHRSNSDNLNKRMRQEFPTYNYIILPKILKN